MSLSDSGVRVNQSDKKPLLTGCASAACSTVIFQPLDLVKTRLQSNAAAGAGSSSHRIISTFASVIRKEGATGLWRGTVPSLGRNVPGIGLYFLSIDFLQRTISGNSNCSLSPVTAAATGICARTFAGVLLLPMTLMKTKYESGLFHYSSLSQAVRLTYATDGFRGFFRGTGPVLLRDVPYSGLYFMFYSQLKQKTTAKKSHEIFVCGFSSGLLACLMTQPFDVLKTNMQLQLHSPCNLGVLSTSVLIFQTKGLSSFFTGVTLRIMRRSLMSALSWTLFESLNKK